jgi:hypothetical protein
MTLVPGSMSSEAKTPILWIGEAAKWTWSMATFDVRGGVCVDVGNVGEVIGRESGRFWDANRGWCFEVGDCFEADK